MADGFVSACWGWGWGWRGVESSQFLFYKAGDFRVVFFSTWSSDDDTCVSDNRCYRRMVKMYLVGLHRLEGLWLPAAMESMPSLSYISFEQCNEVSTCLH